MLSYIRNKCDRHDVTTDVLWHVLFTEPTLTLSFSPFKARRLTQKHTGKSPSTVCCPHMAHSRATLLATPPACFGPARNMQARAGGLTEGRAVTQSEPTPVSGLGNDDI